MARERILITHRRLLEVMDYDPETGAFKWKVRSSKCIRVGNVAGSKSNNGYLRIFIEGVEYLAHRLAWFYVHGVWPAHSVDHINGVRTDNRICNLRDVPRRVNSQNLKKATARNALGVLGVRQKTRGSFATTINIGGKDRYIGSFPTAELAHAAYLDAKRRYHAGCTI